MSSVYLPSGSLGLSLVCCFCYHCISTEEVNRAYVLVTIFICLSVSLLVTCISYVKIRRRVICTPREENKFNTRNRFDASSVRLSRSLVGVFAISFLLWLPAVVVHIAKKFCPRCFPPVLSRTVNALRQANSTVNPLVYSFKMPAFKNGLGRLRLRWRQNMEVRPSQEENRLD